MNTTFDFQNNNIEVLDLDTLKATHKENDIYGNPLRGVYHYEVINRIMDICKNSHVPANVNGGISNNSYRRSLNTLAAKRNRLSAYVKQPQSIPRSFPGVKSRKPGLLKPGRNQ